MASKEDVQSLVKRIIKEANMGTQEAVSLGAGYKKKTLTQRISNGKELDAVYSQLMLVYGHRLKKSTQTENIPIQVNQGLIETLIQKLIVVSETTNGLLEQQQRDIADKVKKIDANLSTALGGVQQISLHVESAREVMLDSMSRTLEKGKRNLRVEADKKLVLIAEERRKQGNAAGKGI